MNAEFTQRSCVLVLENQIYPHFVAASAPEAMLDAGARHPPPRCHPGTRITINEKLYEWSLDYLCTRAMIWLFGPAGVGKTAVAQTFAERIQNEGRLGASFFFSATKERSRSDPFRVIPTLAYQLAINDSGYRHIVSQRLASDPSVLDATLEVQFRKLIIEPFLYLRASRSLQHNSNDQTRILIVLDGLDECSSDDAQCQLVELIRDAAQRHDLPFIWLLCSRPERHLKYTFSQFEFVRVCGREELLIDHEARIDVENFLRDRLMDIYRRYQEVISTSDGRWPPEADLDLVIQKADGYFVFASTAERFIADAQIGNPSAQLTSLVNMLRGLNDAGVNSPLEALDALYSRILVKVSDRAWSIASRILALQIYGLFRPVDETPADPKLYTAKRLWNFMQIDEATFQGALQGLHSVIDIPGGPDAETRGISFYHKSFCDYLVTPHRAKMFFLSSDQADCIRLSYTLQWYQHVLYAESIARVTSDDHGKGVLALKQWAGGEVSPKGITKVKETMEVIYATFGSQKVLDLNCSKTLYQFNFGLLDEETSEDSTLLHLSINLDTRKLFNDYHFVRTKIHYNDVDPKLLRNLSLLTNGRDIEALDLEAAKDTLSSIYNQSAPAIRFAIVGQGVKSGLACIFRREQASRSSLLSWHVIWLNAELPPTENQKFIYHQWARQLRLQDLQKRPMGRPLLLNPIQLDNFPEITSAEELQVLAATKELIKAERELIQNLETMRRYSHELSRSNLAANSVLFQHLGSLLEFQRQFLRCILEMSQKPWKEQRWGLLFCEKEDDFVVYDLACNQSAMSSNSDFLRTHEMVLKPLDTIIHVSNVASYFEKPSRHLNDYARLLDALIEGLSTATYPYHAELQKGAEAVQRIIRADSDARCRSENQNTTRKLASIVDDWKGHHLQNFGELLVSDILIVTTPNRRHRPFHVFVFENILLFFKMVPEPDQDLRSDSDRTKKTPVPLGNVSLLLKGRISMTSVDDIVDAVPSDSAMFDTHTNIVHPLEVVWEGDSGPEHLIIHCRDEAQMHEWAVVLNRRLQIMRKQTKHHLSF
ncbi:hypothetical protein NP233_g8169 [Leucocoprinus birnbaumii]|uniref:NACHT domain-containing protein n=1 Tax=Leucocoprinus birnbaumii TaxID=56174 RepID=A0AAD5YS42_9AGAR|nr:hypothetical protein NP233_g8169 [Leucocoprinus birnbaumii]